jgi:hypothetical protein
MAAPTLIATVFLIVKTAALMLLIRFKRIQTGTVLEMLVRRTPFH